MGDPWFLGWHQFWWPVRWQGYAWLAVGIIFFGAAVGWMILTTPSGWKIALLLLGFWGWFVVARYNMEDRR